jgi:hypothetical protein
MPLFYEITQYPDLENNYLDLVNVFTLKDAFVVQKTTTTSQTKLKQEQNKRKTQNITERRKTKQPQP